MIELARKNQELRMRAVEPFAVSVRRNDKMHSWLKTCGATGTSCAVRLIHGSATVTVTIILLGSNALPQSESGRVGMSANELARRVITNELKFQYDDHGHWMYRLEKEESGRKQVQEIVETNNGSLSRSLSIDGHPLDAKQQQKENQRLQRLVSHPDEQRKLQQATPRRQNKGRDCSIFCLMYLSLATRVLTGTSQRLPSDQTRILSRIQLRPGSSTPCKVR
jgi:hypothetical protein